MKQDGPPRSLTPVPQTQATDGWQFTRNAANGVPLEAVVLSENTLTYETGEYKRWNVFKQRLDKVCGDMISLASTSLDLASITLEYVDRFIYEGPLSGADARLLLRSGVESIPEQASSGASQWHLYRGWFENTPGGKVLINQNYDIQDGVQVNRVEPQRSLQILTNAAFRAPQHELEFEHLHSMLDELHGFTNFYVTKALQPSQLATIGLSNEP